LQQNLIAKKKITNLPEIVKKVTKVQKFQIKVMNDRKKLSQIDGLR